MSWADAVQLILGAILIVSALGVILSRKPVISCLWFLLTLGTLATIYLQLYAQFIAVMQLLVYAGAILVIFMFVIVLFQDAHIQLEKYRPQSSKLLLSIAGVAFFAMLLWLGKSFLGITVNQPHLSENYGTVQALGEKIYLDFFFPFEAVIMLFLVAIIGALYIGRKGEG